MYDNDTRFSTWLSEGGAMGSDPEFSGGLSGLDGLGRRKRRKRRAGPRAKAASPLVRLAARKARQRQAAAGSPVASMVPASRTVAAPVSVRSLPSSVPQAASVVVPAASAPSFDAAAADAFESAFSAAAAAAPSPDSVAVLPGGGDDAFSVVSSGDPAPEVEDLQAAAGDAGPDQPIDAETLRGLGRLRLKKFFKKVAKVASPIASIALPVVGGAVVGAAGSALQRANASSKGAGMVSRIGQSVGKASVWSNVRDAFGNFLLDAVARVGDALVDAAGNVIARQSGGKWQRVAPVAPVTPPAPGSAAPSSIPVPLLVGGGVLLFLLLSRRR